MQTYEAEKNISVELTVEDRTTEVFSTDNISAEQRML